jgi:hypothetical protein
MIIRIPQLTRQLRATWDERKYREVIAAYLGQISMIDHYLGQLFDQLKEKDSEPIYELYDLAKDPFETRNVFGLPENIEPGESLRARLDTWSERQAERYPEELDHSYKN